MSWSDDLLPEAAEAYAAGMSLNALGRRYGCSSDTVRKHLAEAGVQIRDRHLVLRAFGEEKTVAEWARDPRCRASNEAALQQRVRAGWDPQAAVETGPIERGGKPRKARSRDGDR